MLKMESSSSFSFIKILYMYYVNIFIVFKVSYLWENGLDV